MDLIVCGLAAWQAVEVWHHGEIFAGWRSVTESWAYLPGRWNAPRRFIADLLACPWCTSVWTGWIIVGLWFIPWLSWLVLGLAVSRVANVFHDIHVTTLRKGIVHESETRTYEGSADALVSAEATEETEGVSGRQDEFLVY